MTLINDTYALATNGGLANPDLPDVGNVVVGDTVNDVPGTYASALVTTVTSGTQYGEDDIEFTGTYVDTAAPDITIEATGIDSRRN